jgi:hypothetical protein
LGSELVPDTKTLVSTSLAMMGIIVNLLLIITVVTSVPELKLPQTTAPFLHVIIRTIMLTLAAFGVSVVAGLLSAFSQHEDFRFPLSKISFLAFLAGIAIFLALTIQILAALNDKA